MMKSINSLFGIVFALYGLSLITGIHKSPGLLRTIDVGFDPVGVGALFFLLGLWILINDKKGK